MAGKIPDIEKSFQDFLTSHNEKMQFEELNFDEFEEAFKAAGFDDLSNNIIIDANDNLKKILFHVFKVSIKQEIFPESLKIAKVTPIFKSAEYTLGVFIDLSKAFDTAAHQILIKKSQYYGIDGAALEWFKSYLSNKK